MPSNSPDLETYWAALGNVAPIFSVDEQHAAVALYRELAKGEPMTEDHFAVAANLSVDRARTLLASAPIRPFLYYDKQDRIAGFGGLAVSPMHHRFGVDGRHLWTWCAWDSLFIPQILAADAHVESPDPETGDVVCIDVTSRGAATAVPPGAVMSFLAPDASAFRESAADVMTRFCHYVFLFTSRESGQRWIDKHPGTFLYSVEDAADLARRFNARNYPVALGLD